MTRHSFSASTLYAMNETQIKNQLHKIDFNATIMPTKHFFPDYVTRLPEGNAKVVIARKNDNSLLATNFCSSNYNVIPNRSLFRIVEKLAKTKKVHVVTSTNYFNSTITINVLPDNYKGGKFSLNDIIPSFMMVTSLNGKEKAKYRAMANRVVCENQMTTSIDGSVYEYVFKHTEGNGFDYNEILRKMDEYLVGFDLIKEATEILKGKIVKVKEMPEIALEMIKGTVYPSRQIELARHIAIGELSELRSISHEKNMQLNMWLVYNGLNYILNHDRLLVEEGLMKKELSIEPFQRMVIDAKIQKNAFELVKQV